MNKIEISEDSKILKKLLKRLDELGLRRTPPFDYQIPPPYRARIHPNILIEPPAPAEKPEKKFAPGN